MNIKRFNENIEEIDNVENIEEIDTNGIFESEIFREIETDIEDMDQAEAEDYLLSIITFCNQQLKNFEQQ